MMRQLRDPTPKSRFRIIALVWVLWASVAVVGLTTGFVLLTGSINVNTSRNFLGTLKPNPKLTRIRLPAEIPLKTVLVKPGETVRRGQTVALLDSEAIKTKLLDVNRDLAVAGILRECLLSLEAEDFSEAYFDSLAAKSKDTLTSDQFETDLRSRAAMSECKTNWREERLKKERLENALIALQEKLVLVERKLTMVLAFKQMSSSTQTVHPVVRAHAGISIALQKSDIQAQIQTLSSELKALSVDAHKLRLAKVAELSEMVSAKLTQRAVMARYLQVPRLRSPKPGTIERIRPILAGKEYRADENLFELRPEGSQRYHVEFRAPLNMAKGLTEGADVTLSLLGFTERGPNLQGTVESLLRGENLNAEPFVVVSIALTEKSIDLLSDRSNGIALRGDTTASDVSVRLTPHTLRNHLIDTWMGHLANQGWIARYL